MKVSDLVAVDYDPAPWCRKGLTSFEGAPKMVRYNANFSHNYLTSFEHAPKRMQSLFCANNEFTSLKDIHKHIRRIDGIFFCRDNPVKSHVLGLLLIEGLQHVYIDNTIVEEILNRHLGKGRAGMLMAQEELIEAGLEEFAQL